MSVDQCTGHFHGHLTAKQSAPNKEWGYSSLCVQGYVYYFHFDHKI